MRPLTDQEKQDREAVLNEISGRYEGCRQHCYEDLSDYNDLRECLEDCDQAEARERDAVYLYYELLEEGT